MENAGNYSPGRTLPNIYEKIHLYSVLFKNHGLLVATSSIEATVHFFVALEKSCHVQLLADAAGKTVKIGDEDAADTYKTVGTAYAGWFSGRPTFQILEANEGVKFEYSKSK